MLPYAGRTALAGFDSGGGELDQPFEKIGRGAVPSGGMPERFPFFMRFPVEAVIEQVDGVQIRFVVVIGRFVKRLRRWLLAAKAMALLVARGMREQAWHVAIRRELALRTVARRSTRGHGNKSSRHSSLQSYC